ncbi:MAG: tyrosine-type recombinase/integrase [Blautia faecis]
MQQKYTRYYELFYIILNTGMRIGEITALCWSDIDFECHTEFVYIKH